jgi:hypothetical protein
MCKIDLKKAYLCLGINEKSRKYLRFRWKNKLYQFLSMPFGLASGPRVFTKMLKPVVAILRRLGIRLVIYLDDILILNQREMKLLTDRNTTLWLLQKLGFVINWEKSYLNPSQSMEYLGFVVESLNSQLSLPLGKVDQIKAECQRLLNLGIVTVREMAQLLGRLNAARMAVHPGPLFYRQLQMLKTRGLLRGKSYEAQIHLDLESRSELRWWRDHLNNWNGKTFLSPSPDLVICSDASMQGWGCVCGDVKTQGLWSKEESSWHINALELQAANFAIRAFTIHKSNLHVLLKIDNTRTLAYINRIHLTRSL